MSAICLPPIYWRLLSAAYVPTRRPEFTFEAAVYALGLTSSFTGEVRRIPLLGTSVDRVCGCLPCRSLGPLLYPFEHPSLHDEVGYLNGKQVVDQSTELSRHA